MEIAANPTNWAVLGELRAILTGAGQELPKPSEKSFVKEGEILKRGGSNGRLLRGRRRSGSWQRRHGGWIDQRLRRRRGSPRRTRLSPKALEEAAGLLGGFLEWVRTRRES